jgi:ABC-type antimicrobial peptide transport system permease subunit
MSGNGWNEFVDVPNTPVQRKLANFSAVTSDYFRTLDIPLNTGRDFNDSDTPDSPPVAIVNEAFAKVVFGALNIVGRTFGVKQDAGKPDKIYEVIGVVGNTRYTDLREHYGPIAFIADSQDDAPDAYATVLIRSSQDFPPLTSALRTMAERSSADMVVYFSSLRQTIRNGLGRERLIAALSGFYGGLAVLLSMVGLYGVMSYTVVRRTFEIGVRVALGAGKIRVLAIIGGDVLLMTGAGVAFGLMLIVAVSAALKAMLYGVSPTDPQTLLCAIGGVTIVALLAGLAPARRAANIDPMRALRHD